MAPLLLEVQSPVVKLVHKWMKDGDLPGFDLLGRVDEGVASWSQDLLKKQTLNRLDFGNHGMELDLSGHELSSERILQITKAIPGDKALTGLHLAGSRVGDAGMELLSKAIAKSSVLEVLVLSRNGLSAKACEGLATMLERSPTLRTLELGGNAIGSVGAAALGEALVKNDFLTDLGLSSNGITDEGAECLAAAVEVNPHALELLDLSGNRLSEGGAAMLAAAFESSRGPGRLHLGGGPARPVWPIEGDRSEQFTVRCEPMNVRILPGRRIPWEPAASKLGSDPPAGESPGKPAAPAPHGSPEKSESPLESEMTFEDEEDEVDVCFRSQEIRECDRAAMVVEITERQLVIQVKGRSVIDTALYSLTDPRECSWTVRDGALEVYLVKAQEGEDWPRLSRQ